MSWHWHLRQWLVSALTSLLRQVATVSELGREGGLMGRYVYWCLSRWEVEAE